MDREKPQHIDEVAASAESLSSQANAAGGADGLSRREFFGAAAGLALLPTEATSPPARPMSGSYRAAVQAVTVDLRVNGTPTRLSLDPRTTLLAALRDHLGLGGARRGCEHGGCGACTVLSGGRRVYACLSLAASHAGRDLTTVEGLSGSDRPHPVEQALIDGGAALCDSCAAGQVVALTGILSESTLWNQAAAALAPKTPGGSVGPALLDAALAGHSCPCGSTADVLTALKTQSGSLAGSPFAKGDGSGS